MSMTVVFTHPDIHSIIKFIMLMSSICLLTIISVVFSSFGNSLFKTINELKMEKYKLMSKLTELADSSSESSKIISMYFDKIIRESAKQKQKK